MTSTIDTVFGPKGKAVRVERKGSRAGDAIRQGRIESPPLAPGSLELVFEARADGCTHALLGSAEVGVICAQHAERGAREGFNWLSFLPEQHSKPKFAENLPKAKDALRMVTERWCEAARLVARPAHPNARRGSVTGWRAGDGA